LLDRDVANIVGYFERKYPSELSGVDTDALAEAVRADSFDSAAAFA
jgi:RIO kinase 2